MKTIESINLRSLALLQAVAAHGGFAEAGRQMALPRAVVSQLIAQLESQLDAKLFKRTTRKVALTEAGESLLARIGEPLAQIQAGLRTTQAQSDDLAGTVRLSVSHALGRLAVLPALPAFTAQHPQVQLEVLLADRIDDLIDKNLDLTIRMGPLPDSSMVARKLGDLAVGLFAAPELLGAWGAPGSLAQLQAMPAVGFRVPGSGALYGWQLASDKKSGEQHTIVSQHTPAICNSIEGVIDLARLGAGVAAIPSCLVAADVRDGRLVAVLKRHKLPSIPVHLHFASRSLMPKRVRVLMDHLAETLPVALQ
jgi:DNA-binding transcriptional LysR family regulator